MLKNLLARILVSRQRGHGFPVEYLEAKHVNRGAAAPNDSSCFYGGDEKGNAAIFRLAFRGPRRDAECWLDVKLEGKPAFGLPANPGPERDGFALGDVSFLCLRPGKTWRIAYQGPLTDEVGNLRDGEVDLVFEATHPIFDYGRHTDRSQVAAALAREKWSREFFLRLKDLSQVHYEQLGRLTGTVRFGEERTELTLWATRDHSFGSRDWRSWDRHFFLSGVTPDGHGFTAVAIRYTFCGPLYVGFTVAPDGTSDAIVECSSLEEVARERLWPESGVVQVCTRSGARHTLAFERRGVFAYHGDGVYLMREGIGFFRWDGRPAYGLCEFGFSKERYGKLIEEKKPGTAAAC